MIIVLIETLEGLLIGILIGTLDENNVKLAWI